MWTTIQAPGGYSSVIRIITPLNIPRPRPGNLFPIPPGPQWPHWKLKEVTPSWILAATEPLFERLSFVHELATLRVRSVHSATRNKLERVTPRTRPDLDVSSKRLLQVLTTPQARLETPHGRMEGVWYSLRCLQRRHRIDILDSFWFHSNHVDVNEF